MALRGGRHPALHSGQQQRAAESAADHDGEDASIGEWLEGEPEQSAGDEWGHQDQVAAILASERLPAVTQQPQEHADIERDADEKSIEGDPLWSQFQLVFEEEVDGNVRQAGKSRRSQVAGKQEKKEVEADGPGGDTRWLLHDGGDLGRGAIERVHK